MLAIYCRTSKSKEEGKDYSIETQKDGGLKLASQLEIQHEFFVDEGVSGALPIIDRPEFSRLMTLLRQGKISAVYCYDQSRIERDDYVWRIFSAECIVRNCKFYPNGLEFDLKDDTNMLQASIMSLMNSYYAKITSKKVTIANKNKALKGKTHGLKPYGYIRDKNNDYQIYEEEAIHVRRMFQLSLEGTGTYTIANIFNEEGIPTKFNRFSGTITRIDKYTRQETKFEKSNVKWRGNVIHDILRNPIYKGIRVWNSKNLGERAEIEIDAKIITPELWEKVNKNLSLNIKNVGKNAEYHYLLNGLLFCSDCGNQIIGKKRLKGNDNAYKCKGKRPPHKECTTNRGLSLPKFENFIIQHLFFSKNLKSLLIDAPKNNTELDSVKTSLNAKLNELSSTEKKSNKLYILMTNPDLDNDLKIINDYNKSKSRIKNLKEDINILQNKVLELENNVRNKRTETLIESYMEGIGFSEIKRLVHSLIYSIEVKHVKKEKSGYFILKIQYKNYGDISMFITDWMSYKWEWVSYYRPFATNENQLIEDKALLDYLAPENDENISEKEINSFKGLETLISMHESVSLNKDSLIIFD